MRSGGGGAEGQTLKSRLPVYKCIQKIKHT